MRKIIYQTRLQKIFSPDYTFRMPARLIPLLWVSCAIAWAQPALVSRADLRPGVAALPRLRDASSSARRINQALNAADERARLAAEDCDAQTAEARGDKTEPAWQRTVTVAMRGPRYLALVASDNWYCGGAYPDTSRFALVYDLNTGEPVNWMRLLPKTLVRAAAMDTAGDGTRLGVIDSPQLTALYLKMRKADADCMDALRSQSLTFLLWPDAKQEGLAMEPSNLPHVIAACGGEVLIPLQSLRALGVDAGLLNAIAAAHGAQR